MGEQSSFLLGLIGWPLEHSLSPVIHEAALKACGLEGEYKLFPIQHLPSGEEVLEEILLRLLNGEIQGLNVTIPHKQNVIPYLDSLTPCAQEIGAVNMIFQEKGKLIGDNTDKDGFLIDLKQKVTMEDREKTALVLGAGGSSRAVTYALSMDGWRVHLAARRLEQAQTLAEEYNENLGFDISALSLDFEALNKLQVFLIVNTTPLGMAPEISASPWPSDISFPKGCFIYDLVYNPNETLLVKHARNLGLKASNGLGMLVEQAALAFEIWTGFKAPRISMYEAVSDQLKQLRQN
ncbi:MAG: shikimate dehydrogenase [Chloroflexi bacterium]|nr:shikimate dehydrogenase [Chloroflexota bacterium]